MLRNLLLIALLAALPAVVYFLFQQALRYLRPSTGGAGQEQRPLHFPWGLLLLCGALLAMVVVFGLEYTRGI